MIIYNFIKNLYLVCKYNKIISHCIKNEKLLENLYNATKINFKADNINRIYGVANINNEDLILEYNVNNETYSIDMFIEKFIMTRMNILSNFILSNNLFEVLTYKIKKIDDYNYLIVFENIFLQKLFKYSKLFLLLICILSILLIVLL